ncbi:condensation domain-containing protein [Micromonospora pisi]|uniref:Condensation domain-containing protein n=1 Tax=Micromonospora pisi TaxID=589240 RepID=A0A495JBR0_9ACTN|nr:condensation domain-containing protein [Micromonospora pisi]RKR86253.1 condensation domain-containing protein [Micromonospora pisi]
MVIRAGSAAPPPAEPAASAVTIAGAATEWTVVDFVGEGQPVAPLTWGQRALWNAIERHGPGYVMISLRRTLAVPRRAGRDPDTVSRALATLIGRHSSLRTRMPVVDGERCQVVADRGGLPVLLVRADPAALVAIGDDDGAALARTVAERLADRQFDHAHEWPQRVGLILVAGEVRQIAVVFSHTTVDFHAIEILLRDLRLLLLRGSIAAPAGLQSVDVARREQNGEERRQAERAVGHWVRSFDRLPVDTLPRLGPALTPRFRRAVLTSTSADTAIRLIAARHRVTSSTVLVAAAAVVAAHWSGNEVVGVHSMASNRSRDGYRDAVAKLNQLGLVVVELADRPDFADLLPRVWRAALAAYRHAYYDPTWVRQALRARGHPYAEGVSPHLYLNDIRLSTDVDLFGRATEESEVRAAMADSSCTWTHGLDTFTWRTRIEVIDRPGGVGLALTADTAHLPPDAIERFLRDLERLLVDAAFGNLPWPWR